MVYANFNYHDDNINSTYKHLFGQYYYGDLFSSEKDSTLSTLQDYIKKRDLESLLFYFHYKLAKTYGYKIKSIDTGISNHINYNKKEITFLDKTGDIKEKLFKLSTLLGRVASVENAEGEYVIDTNFTIYQTDEMIKRRYSDDRDVRLISNLLMFNPLFINLFFDDCYAKEYIKILIEDVGIRPQFLCKLLKLYLKHNIIGFIIATFYMEDIQNILK